jgi:hypothetical protein
MKSLPFLLAVLLVTSLSGCSGESWRKAFTAKVVVVSYDDLGTETMLSPILGPRGNNPQIVVHHGATNKHAEPRRLNDHQGLLILRRNSRRLPDTAENEALRQRMTAAYHRLHACYNQRRNAFLSVPPFAGRGSMSMTRMNLMPPVPPSL